MACGQGMQVMHCMTNELLRDDLFFLFKEHHDFRTKEGKSETGSKRRPFFFREHCDFGTKKKRDLRFISGDFFLGNTVILARKKSEI